MSEFTDKIVRVRTRPYYQSSRAQLYLGDCFHLLSRTLPESIDMIFADPPYFLSNDGITCQGGKMVSVNKASWDQEPTGGRNMNLTAGGSAAAGKS